MRMTWSFRHLTYAIALEARYQQLNRSSGRRWTREDLAWLAVRWWAR